MENCFELLWCEESCRYITVPESEDDVYTGSAPAVTLGSSAVADAPGLGCTIGVPPYSRTENLWYPGSQTIDVHGYRTAGMVYVGTGLRSVKGEGIEPALIDPYLRVNTPTTSYKAQDLLLPLSYRKLSSHGRGRYLQWLAEGRTDREVPIEFVFLFFYGLERRLLTEDCPEEEAAELLAEVERLQETYSRNHAFANYSFRLLDFLRAKELSTFCIDIDQYAAPSVRRLWDQTYASMLRVGLGQCAADCMEVHPGPLLGRNRILDIGNALLPNDVGKNLRICFERNIKRAFPTAFV
jgi:hypothetical protein